VCAEHVLALDAPWLTYIAFDYHAAPTDTLVSAANNILADIGFTWTDNSARTVCAQSGIVRTNCVDCLDRTNVVQTLLALQSLQLCLFKVGVCLRLTSASAIDAHRRMWADHGDALSLQYAGTAALKGEPAVSP